MSFGADDLPYGQVISLRNWLTVWVPHPLGWDRIIEPRRHFLRSEAKNLGFYSAGSGVALPYREELFHLVHLVYNVH